MKSAAILRFAAMLASAITLIASFATPARAETFEFAVWFSDRDFYADYVRTWASEIEKRTEGRVKMKLHFSGALVAAKETVYYADDAGTNGNADLVPQVAQRSAGNPLFVEEMVNRIREEGSQDVQRLPETVHAVLAARLDSLSAPERVFASTRPATRERWLRQNASAT